MKMAEGEDSCRHAGARQEDSRQAPEGPHDRNAIHAAHIEQGQ